MQKKLSQKYLHHITEVEQDCKRMGTDQSQHMEELQQGKGFLSNGTKQPLYSAQCVHLSSRETDLSPWLLYTLI